MDNNSSDETRHVLKDFQRRYPELVRHVFEPQQGLSYARNSGVRQAKGEILAFMDDDETADEMWVQNLTRNLHSGEWAGAGGRVLPQWSESRPRWLSTTSSFAMAPLALFDLQADAGELREPPFGANMAFRKDVFALCGEFRTDLGRSGKGMLSGEDTEFGRRVMSAGLRLRYEPLAVTHHPVAEGRTRRKYFLVFWFNKGRSDVREFGSQSNARHFLGIPPRWFRGIAVEAVRWMVTREPSQRFVSKLKVWCFAGQAFERYNQWRDSARTTLAHRASPSGEES